MVLLSQRLGTMFKKFSLEVNYQSVRRQAQAKRLAMIQDIILFHQVYKQEEYMIESSELHILIPLEIPITASTM
jgi:hypothetical protein